MPQRYIMRPLLKNYGQPKEGESVAQCGQCGVDCIKRPQLEVMAIQAYPNILTLCTTCSLKKSL